MAIPSPVLSNEDIQQEVANELKWGTEVEAHEISIAVREGLVTLTGWVDRFGKRLAAHAPAWSTQVPDDAVPVTVSNERVTLQGEVDADSQRREAPRAVRSLFGVRNITNLITVRPHSASMPDYLTDRIATVLIRNALIDARRITVTVAGGGRVTLAGTVRFWAERQEAERAAWRARGVTRIENRITLHP